MTTDFTTTPKLTTPPEVERIRLIFCGTNHGYAVEGKPSPEGYEGVYVRAADFDALKAQLRAYQNTWRIVREKLGLPEEHPDGSDVLPVIAALQDNPLWDGTDAALPAWWRGHDYATNELARHVFGWLSGNNENNGKLYFKWQAVKDDILRLRAQIRKLETTSREYMIATDSWIACGDNDDPTKGKCGDCRACLLVKVEQLTAENERLQEAEKKYKFVTAQLWQALGYPEGEPIDLVNFWMGEIASLATAKQQAEAAEARAVESEAFLSRWQRSQVCAKCGSETDEHFLVLNASFIEMLRSKEGFLHQEFLPPTDAPDAGEVK